MAPSGTFSDAASTTSAESSGSLGSENPGPSHTKVYMWRRNPPMLRMVLEALKAEEVQRPRATSVMAIKVYILKNYPTVNAGRFKYLLKQALATGMRRGLLARPVKSRATGATGSFKLVPRDMREIQAKKNSHRRRSREAVGKGSKKPGQAQKEAAGSGQVEKATLRPEAANQKVPRRGRQEPKHAEASKPPPKPAKATQAPSRANGTSEKAKVKGKGSRQDAETTGKSKAKNASSKPTAKQVKNGVASPAKRKVAAKTPKETAGQGAGQRSKTKAAAVSQKGNGSKAVPAALARKTEAPEGPRKPRIPAKSSSSKAPGKKTETKR